MVVQLLLILDLVIMKTPPLSYCNIYTAENAQNAAYGSESNVPSAAACKMHGSVMKHIYVTANGDQNKCIIYSSSQLRK